MKQSDYTPRNAALFKEMLRNARQTDSREQLTTFTICWTLAPQYPRQDIVATINIVEIEKGWRCPPTK